MEKCERGGEIGALSCEFTLPTFQCSADNKSARFPKNAETFLKCHGGRIDAMATLNWMSCCTFGGFTQPSKVLHSDGKFIQPNMWTVDPSFASSSSSFSSFLPFFQFFQFPRYINHSLPSCPPCFPREGLW